MFSLSSWRHLRIPFSYFLMPVFLFSLSISPNLGKQQILWVFVLVHLFLYPASNGYNSYFDKDEKSIGGLKNPPPVKRGLYFLAVAFDFIAIVAGFFKIGLLFALMLLIYGLVSKAYSHPMVRLKKYPIAGWIVTGFFQGFFTFVMCYIGLNNFGIIDVLRPEVLIPAMLSSMMLWGSYPMTQVYQHEEDLQRGDITLSIRLGIRGTFYFTALVFSISMAGFGYYFITFHEVRYVLAFVLALFPTLLFFAWWLYRVYHNTDAANHSNTMLLNWISATGLNVFFLYFLIDSTHVVQAIQGGY